MKTTLCFTLTLLIFVTLTFVPNSFAQNASPEYVMRVVYFLPNDREPNPEIDTQLDTLMKEAQQSYADVMESYGFGRKTFRLETDGDGKVVVHHVNGQDNDAYYHDGTFSKALNELEPNFDTSKNIYFVAIDISSERFDVNQPNSHICGQALQGGWAAATPASGICFNFRVIAHELGHTFGLSHDSFNYSGIDAMVDSFCSAEWLDVHPYFNEGSQTDFNEPTTVNMLPPSRAPSSNAIRFSFEVRDADGLHQAQLYVPALDSVADCKRLTSESTTVEFDTTYVVSELNFISLKVIDVNGNHTEHGFPVDISAFVLPPKRVTIPDVNLAAAIRANTDLPPNAEITTHTMVRLTQLFPISDDPITNLTGLEYAVNLVALSLYTQNTIQNTITGFSSLSELRELRFLELPGTDISNISPLSGLTKLKVLYLHRNNIQDISVLAGLTNLKTLELWDNNISNITPLAGLTNLTYLALNSNQISDVSPLAELTNLDQLYLAGNPIEDFSPLRILLANNPNLNIDIDVPFGFTRNFIPDQTFVVGTDVSLTLPIAASGTTPYTYTLSPMPAGLQFDNATRRLSGTPTTAGTTNATYTATDASGQTASLTFTVTVTSALITFNPATIADQTFTVGEVVNLTLPVAGGGTPPYTYTLSPIPNGLVFDASTRTLSGTPTTPAPATDATYTATDATGISASLTFTITVEVNLDVNGDGRVDVLDLVQVALFYGKRGDNLPEDINADGVINVPDLVAVAEGVDAADDLVEAVEQGLLRALVEAAALQEIAEAPIAGGGHQHALSLRLTYDNVAAALADVRMLARSDARLRKGVAVLERLLALLTEMRTIPDQTVLLPNYPNPFNPETWLPYQLSTPSAVTLSIHSIDGQLVRTLDLGHQPAGVYHSKHRAAYWDGRNQHGEKVASGVYFYTLTAGDFTATRKLLIAK